MILKKKKKICEERYYLSHDYQKEKINVMYVYMSYQQLCNKDITDTLLNYGSYNQADGSVDLQSLSLAVYTVYLTCTVCWPGPKGI